MHGTRCSSPSTCKTSQCALSALAIPVSFNINSVTTSTPNHNVQHKHEAPNEDEPLSQHKVAGSVEGGHGCTRVRGGSRVCAQRGRTLAAVKRPQITERYTIALAPCCTFFLSPTSSLYLEHRDSVSSPPYHQLRETTQRLPSAERQPQVSLGVR